MSARTMWKLLTGIVLLSVWSGCELVAGLGGEVARPGGAGTSGTGGTGGNSGQSGSGGGGSTATGNGGGCMAGATAPCYSGPMGTEAMGLCKPGEKTCNPEGTAYGACAGEVLPAADDCVNKIDGDCNGKVCGEAIWSYD